MTWYKDLQLHEPKQLLVTFHTTGSSGNISISGLHTCPIITTEWWPYTLMELIKKEMANKTVDSISLVDIECVN